MASLMRSAATAAARSVVAHSKTMLPKTAPSRRAAVPLISRRIVSAVGSVESLMPLHSAIASTRLKSFIAVDSSCWSWLSQGRALPL
ncbi:hypothetical protein J5N97_010153 [Dioscorea zingiberensis]|uniref:Protein NUCLEAR FUSION DEFECTIVE 6, chloroplastic/mitochondrial n=1 Tax=Dioscorea zingiberensis TaxID=325984 RepID=A0A9D5CYV6_9LILI|nr:hypothetical protein J5N97_010153 [Dioscorea zingiberensis]